MRSRAVVTVVALLTAIARSSQADDGKPSDEVDVVPLVGGDTDVGFGGGAVLEIARQKGEHGPKLWSLQVASLTTFKPPAGGALRVPYQDDYALFELPDLIPHVLDLQIRPSFTAESTQKYYGLGNDSQIAPRPDDSDPYYDYGRTHATLVTRARLALGAGFHVRVGGSFTWNSLSVLPHTKLADDQSQASPEVRALLGQFHDHAVVFFEQALEFDTRDDEIEPRRGQWHQVEIRESPGGTTDLPYRYAQLDVQARAYVTPIPKRLTFAARVVGDLQMGDPPFYELARFEDTFALGGPNGVRGVPGQRYYGKTKLFGNLEARVAITDFRLFSKDFALGVAAFFDAGRLWADGFDHPELDGTGLGLKYGTGGGVRLRQGKSLVVRVDVGWSPDARPLGGYFAAGEIF